MGGKNVDQRWKACVMSTNLAFGFALTPAYLRQVAFTQKAHDHVHQIVSDVKTAFIRHLEALEWLKGHEKHVGPFKLRFKGSIHIWLIRTG